MVDQEWLKLKDDIDRKITYIDENDAEHHNNLKLKNSSNKPNNIKFKFNKTITNALTTFHRTIGSGSRYICSDYVVDENDKTLYLVLYYTSVAYTSGSTQYDEWRAVYYKLKINDDDTAATLTYLNGSALARRDQTEYYFLYANRMRPYTTILFVCKDYIIYILGRDLDQTASNMAYAKWIDIYKQDKKTGVKTVLTSFQYKDTPATYNYQALAGFNIIGDPEENYIYYTSVVRTASTNLKFSGDIVLNPMSTTLKRMDIVTGATTVIYSGISNPLGVNYQTFLTPLRMVEDKDGNKHKIIYILNAPSQLTSGYTGYGVNLMSTAQSTYKGLVLNSYDFSNNIYKTAIGKEELDKQGVTWTGNCTNDCYTGSPSYYYKHDVPSVICKNLIIYKDKMYCPSEKKYFTGRDTYQELYEFNKYFIEKVFNISLVLLDYETGGKSKISNANDVVVDFTDNEIVDALRPFIKLRHRPASVDWVYMEFPWQYYSGSTNRARFVSRAGIMNMEYSSEAGFNNSTSGVLFGNPLNLTLMSFMVNGDKLYILPHNLSEYSGSGIDANNITAEDPECSIYVYDIIETDEPEEIININSDVQMNI